MTETTENVIVDFSGLNLQERINAVNERIGDQKGRIETIEDLLKCKGQTVYMLISPFGKNDQFNHGTCFIWEWEVGRVIDQYGNELTSSTQVDPANPDVAENLRVLIEHATDTDNVISARDFNIIPNNYNNHGVFANRDDAEAYWVYRKVQFDEIKSLEKLDGEYPYWFTKSHVENFVEMEKQLAE